MLHQVRKGETISSLSLAYRVYTEDIIDANRLSPEGFIVAGETLIIPGATPLPPPLSRPRTSEKVLVDVRGTLINPVPGSHRSQGLHWRNAVDLANSCGAPVVASAGGEVIKADGAGWNGGFGKYVMLAHAAGFVTVYGHLSAISVTPGQQIDQSERIGSLGQTGRATGCHVHFEVRGAANPFAY
ncbi:MAG: LysM peptidoglycan-binding domain-containing M23 family metallopeptidase [Candidatus Colwellbacteria bacterium]|nr:LysM peptidoglycan-binding domain-containing M23 family metallopeptidase [Candidatus Colwellbacteria bacterium]